MKKHVRTINTKDIDDHYRLARIEDKMLTTLAFLERERERETFIDKVKKYISVFLTVYPT